MEGGEEGEEGGGVGRGWWEWRVDGKGEEGGRGEGEVMEGRGVMGKGRTKG